MKKHDFADSLAVGKHGEQQLLKLWPDLEPLDGKKGDFRVRSTGQLVEVKSDQYDANTTANFFIELMSDVHRQKAGGPVQALYHGCDLYVYFFPKNSLVYIFEVEPLCTWLAQNSNKYGIVYIRNAGWTTTGCKIPRTHLQDLYKILVVEDNAHE